MMTTAPYPCAELTSLNWRIRVGFKCDDFWRQPQSLTSTFPNFHKQLPNPFRSETQFGNQCIGNERERCALAELRKEPTAVRFKLRIETFAENRCI